MKGTGLICALAGLSLAAGYRNLLQTITPEQNFNPVSITVNSAPFDVIATPITPVAPYSQAAYQCNVTGDSRFPIYATGTFPLTVSVPKGQLVRVIFANGNLNGATVTQQGEPGVIVQQGGAVIVQQAGGASPIVQTVGSPIVQQNAPPAAFVVQQGPTVIVQQPSYPASPPFIPQSPPTTPTTPGTPVPTSPTTPAPTMPATPTPTPTDTPTTSPTDTPTATPTDTPTDTPTTTPTDTPKDTPTTTPTDTPTASPTDTPTASPTDTPTPSPSDTPAPTCPEDKQCPAKDCQSKSERTDDDCCCPDDSGSRRRMLSEASVWGGRHLLQDTVPGGPNNGLVEYVGLISANTVPGFVVPNTEFGIPYVEFTASDASVGQTASFQGSLLVATVVGGVPQYPFTPNINLSPQCQVNVNFLTV